MEVRNQPAHIHLARATDSQEAAMKELLFSLARLIGRQVAEDQIQEQRAANDNRAAGERFGHA